MHLPPFDFEVKMNTILSIDSFEILVDSAIALFGNGNEIV